MKYTAKNARSLFGAGSLFLLSLVFAACGGGQTDGGSSDAGTQTADAPPAAHTASSGTVLAGNRAPTYRL